MDAARPREEGFNKTLCPFKRLVLDKGGERCHVIEVLSAVSADAKI
jgi:hypothetical protein